jgi:uncharacterized phiE125 gp8 family phage protein
MSFRDYQSLELVTPAAALPLSTAEVKEHLAIDGTDRDDLILQMINAAVGYIDGLGVLGKSIITQTWGQWTGVSPGDVILRMHPVQSLSAVKYFDTDGVFQTATVSDFDLQQAGEWALVKPHTDASWPSAQSREAAIRIDFVAGYGLAVDVPDPIKQALMMLVAHWFENRESSSESRLVETPFGFNEIISTYRSSWYS